ncbi:hypothetical protein AMQ68_12710 [Chryseobacterium sp. ERMR1:04]|nr:hypothetical protein AMQ68_12710 [Chryseobacterium sp. ERMR1:04]
MALNFFRLYSLYKPATPPYSIRVMPYKIEQSVLHFLPSFFEKNMGSELSAMSNSIAGEICFQRKSTKFSPRIGSITKEA